MVDYQLPVVICTDEYFRNHIQPSAGHDSFIKSNAQESGLCTGSSPNISKMIISTKSMTGGTNEHQRISNCYNVSRVPEAGNSND